LTLADSAPDTAATCTVNETTSSGVEASRRVLRAAADDERDSGPVVGQRHDGPGLDGTTAILGDLCDVHVTGAGAGTPRT
jgi:hypothetical protein